MKTDSLLTDALLAPIGRGGAGGVGEGIPSVNVSSPQKTPTWILERIGIDPGTMDGVPIRHVYQMRKLTAAPVRVARLAAGWLPDPRSGHHHRPHVQNLQTIHFAALGIPQA